MTDTQAAVITSSILLIAVNVWAIVGYRLGWGMAWRRIPVADRIFAGAVALWVVAFAAWMGAG
jgi:hypothetical protein